MRDLARPKLMKLTNKIRVRNCLIFTRWQYVFFFKPCANHFDVRVPVQVQLINILRGSHYIKK